MKRTVQLVLTIFTLAGFILAGCASPATPAETSKPEQPGPTEPAEPTSTAEPTALPDDVPTAVPSELPMEYQAITWQLIWLVDQNGEKSNVLADTEITLKIDKDQVSGSAGCNSYNGAVIMVDGKLQIGPLASTMMACPEPIMEQELVYLENLQKTVVLTLEGENLAGKDDNGQVILFFSEKPSLPLVGTLWQVTGYNNGKGAIVSVLPGSQITAQFQDDGQFGGNATCNNYFGSYTLDGENIQIGQVGSTEMACMEPEGAMEQEQAYLNALSTAAFARIEGDQLELRTQDEALAVSYTAVQPKPLAGTVWVLTGYNNGKGGFTSVLAGSEINALFSTDGNLGGSAGCNQYNAGYTIDGAALTIGPAASTRMMCAEPEGVMEQETAYLAALSSVAGFEITGSQLNLLDAEGMKLAEYLAHPLIGEIWILSEIQYMNDTQAVPANPQDYTVQFLPGGILAVQADCNQVSGTYTVNGVQLAIQLGASTKAFCGEESLDQKFLEGLAMSASYIVEGDQLFVATQMDSSIMNFVRMP